MYELIGKRIKKVQSFYLFWREDDQYNSIESIVMKKIARMHLKLYPTEVRDRTSRTTTYYVRASDEDMKKLNLYIEELEFQSMEETA